MTNFFLGRVIERTARGYSVEANPKYIRNVINVLGLEEAKLVRQNRSLSWKVKDEQCTEQLWENCCTCARNEQTLCTA